MRSKVIEDQAGKTHVLVFDKGDEVASGLQAFARRHAIAAGHLTAIGAFSEVVLGYFDRDRRDYARIAVREQVEVLSFIGNIGVDEGQPKVHVHVVIGKADGTAHGGHLLEARVWPTLEVVIEESARPIRRRTDPETGLALIDLDAAP